MVNCQLEDCYRCKVLKKKFANGSLIKNYWSKIIRRTLWEIPVKSS